jgi:CubicO group peptidase (beta-lactamase class C family)
MSARATLQQLGPELRERVAEMAQRLQVPGVAVGIYLGGEEDYVYHGVTSIANPLPVDETTLFQIGSTGKTITATAIMALVERGLVDLAAPVRRYIPELRLQDEDVAANVTVLQILNHTSGWAGDFDVDTGYGDDALERFVARLVEATQEAPLGARVSYSNSAFALAGRLIEKVTGQTFEAAVQELVFDPLGLNEHFYLSWDVMTRRFAAGHAFVGETLQVTEWDDARSGHPPGAGICATARDQIRYARFHLGDPSTSSGQVRGVLSRATLDQMQTPTTPTTTEGAKGIAWALRELDGVRIVSHGGSCRGHQSAFEMVPERDFAFVALTNARHGLELLTELGAWVFDAYLGLAEQVPDPLPLTADELAEYTGAYESYTGVLHVTVEGDRLIGTLEINPQLELAEDEAVSAVPPLPFKILPDDQFLILEGQYKGLRGGLIRDASGRVSALDLGRVFTRRD